MLSILSSYLLSVVLGYFLGKFHEIFQQVALEKLYRHNSEKAITAFSLNFLTNYECTACN